MTSASRNRGRRRNRSRDDRGFRIWTGFFGVVTVLLVAAIGLLLLRQSHLPIEKFGWKFWTTSDWDPVSGEFGALPFIWGSLYSSIFALLLSTPIALGIAIFITEISPHSLRQPFAFLTELLAAIPSIVYGLWGIFVLVPLVRKIETAIAGTPLSKLPIFAGPPYGIGMLAAGLVLTIMVIPYISSVSREVLRAVPRAQREAAYALGATRWEATKIVLRYGRTGVIGAIMLGFGRALGETMAVTMVIGNNPQISPSLFAPQYSMAAVIANEFTEAAGDLYLQSLIEIGLVLFVITLVINALSRLLIWSTARGPRSSPVPEAVPSAASEPA
jgi:phosphate transport system permease protein